jgi:hypothetical protein
MSDEPVRAQWFATIKDGKVAGICIATPPHELTENQIALSRAEYEVLEATHGKIDEAITLIKAVKEKIKANGS